MIVQISETFRQDYLAINDPSLTVKLFGVISRLKQENYPAQSVILKALTEQPYFFKFGLGFYVIGSKEISQNTIVLLRMVYRHEIFNALGV